MKRLFLRTMTLIITAASMAAPVAQAAGRTIPPQIIYWDFLDCRLQSSDSPDFKLPGFLVSVGLADENNKQDIPALFRFIGAEPATEAALYSNVPQAPEVGTFAVLTVNADGAIHDYKLERTTDKKITATLKHYDEFQKKTYSFAYLCKNASK